MTDPAGSTASSNPTVCAGCGCLCDDIRLVLEGGRIVESVNACPIGIDWFRAESTELRGDPAPFRIEGREADFSEAVRRSAELLRGSKAPIVFGLTQTTMETVRATAELADAIGAAIDPGSSGRSAPQVHAFQRQGRVTATLGEVKNRADVIVFWGVDPVSTHPRHAERYSIDANGRFRPGGRHRTVIVVDEAATATSAVADLFIPIVAGKELETLWALRALLLGKPLNLDRVRASTGCPPEDLARLVDRLKGAEYGAIFAEPTFGRGASPRSLAAIEAMAHFVRELNQVARCVLLPLGGPGNLTGAEAVLSWQTGFPQSVDLGPGFPRSIPGVTSVFGRLARGEADIALIVADAIPADLPPSAREHLGRIPLIVIAPSTVDYVLEPTVRFSTGNPFLTSAGTVIRPDGVPLPIRGPIASSVPSDRDCLRAISAELGEHVQSPQS